MAVPYSTLTDPSTGLSRAALMQALSPSSDGAPIPGGLGGLTTDPTSTDPTTGATTQPTKATGAPTSGTGPTGGFTPTTGPNAPKGMQDPSNDPNWAFDQLNASYGGNAKNNQDLFLAMMNSPQNKGKSPQDIINEFNAQKLGADSSGLSSEYGSSPEYYSDGNAIGLPGAVLRQGADGTWTAETRGPGVDSSPTQNGGGASSALGAVQGMQAANAPGNFDFSTANPADTDQFLNSILAYERNLITGGNSQTMNPDGTLKGLNTGALLSSLNG